MGFALTVTIRYSNGQRKTHQIVQIRHVEPQKRQYTTIEVGLHLFWALTRPFLDRSLRYKTLQYSPIHFFTFRTNNQTRRLCEPPVPTYTAISSARIFSVAKIKYVHAVYGCYLCWYWSRNRLAVFLKHRPQACISWSFQNNAVRKALFALDT